MSIIRMSCLAAVVAVCSWGPSSVAQQPGVRPRQQIPLPPAGAPRYLGPRVQPGTRQPTGPPPAAVRQAPNAPFVLNPRQQAALDGVLIAWERQGATVKTMKVGFTRYEYDNTFGKQTISEGVLQYAAPDKGLYRIDKSVVGQQEQGGQKDHWVCDGKSIFQFDAQKKQLIERPIPLEMRGQAIGDGPLPFLFGATANKLKHRYFMRVTTTQQEQANGQIFIEAYPKFQRDAANFARAEIVLSAANLSVRALKIVLPNRQSHTVHTFGKPAINNLLRFIERDFSKPTPPFGWEHVVERPSSGPAPVPSASLPRRPPRGRTANAR